MKCGGGIHDDGRITMRCCMKCTEEAQQGMVGLDYFGFFGGTSSVLLKP